jgi:hypothetical protein
VKAARAKLDEAREKAARAKLDEAREAYHQALAAGPRADADAAWRALCEATKAYVESVKQMVVTTEEARHG